MKRILSIAFALAFAGAFLSGCDRDDANRPAGTGGTSSTTQSGKTPTTPSAPTAPGGTQTDPQKRTPQSPAKP